MVLLRTDSEVNIASGKVDRLLWLSLMAPYREDSEVNIASGKVDRLL